MTGPQGEGSVSVELLCRLGGVSRAMFYRHWQESAPRREETALRDRVQHLCLRPRHRLDGHRRVTAELRREGWCVNRKRALRIMR
jgi:putative transposase